jgi:hypothetical protein
MEANTQTALIGAGISAGLYTLLKSLKYYYEHYYIKSECHGSKELVISLEVKEGVKIDEKEEKKIEIEITNLQI